MKGHEGTSGGRTFEEIVALRTLGARRMKPWFPRPSHRHLCELHRRRQAEPDSTVPGSRSSKLLTWLALCSRRNEVSGRDMRGQRGVHISLFRRIEGDYTAWSPPSIAVIWPLYFLAESGLAWRPRTRVIPALPGFPGRRRSSHPGSALRATLRSTSAPPSDGSESADCQCIGRRAASAARCLRTRGSWIRGWTTWSGMANCIPMRTKLTKAEYRACRCGRKPG